MSKIFAIIPARAGSLGVSDKNIAVVGGVPLLVRSYRIANSLPFEIQTIVSTDSSHYLNLLATEGYGDPSQRPPHLATSESLVIDTIIYELSRCGAQDTDLILLLEPSFVGIRKKNIIAAVNLMQHGEIDSCFGAYSVPPAFHHSKQYVCSGEFAKPVGDKLNINRQQLNTAFVRSGEFYLSRVSLARIERSLFGGRLKILETEKPFVNIDNLDDMANAQLIAEQYIE
jgi:CMP-N,N'-diacetyllegionaminic acid synthase